MLDASKRKEKLEGSAEIVDSGEKENEYMSSLGGGYLGHAESYENEHPKPSEDIDDFKNAVQSRDPGLPSGPQFSKVKKSVACHT